MDAIAPIDFLERSNCTHRILLKKGSLHLSIEIRKALLVVLHPSIDIPNKAPGNRHTKGAFFVDGF